MVLIELKSNSTKLSAAHVTFAAPSRNVVIGFFTSALEAGGRIRGEPSNGDGDTNYYSATVLDLDGNSIEVMHRAKHNEIPRSLAVGTDEHGISSWQKNVLKSTPGRSSNSQVIPAQIIVNNITNSNAVAPRAIPQTRRDGEISTKALFGTILGAAAGAAVAYAMTKGEEQTAETIASKSASNHNAEIKNLHVTQTAAESRDFNQQNQTSHVLHVIPRQIDYPTNSSTGTGDASKLSHIPSAGTSPESLILAVSPSLGILVNELADPTETRQFPPHSIARSQTESIIQPTSSQASSNTVQQYPKFSHVPYTVETVTMATSATSQPSTITEVRLAKDLPLPNSRATSVLRVEDEEGNQSVLDSIAPSDSISQVGSRLFKTSEKSRRHGNSNASKAGNEKSLVSEQTVKGESSKAERKNKSVVGMPLRPTSKASVHRSVRSNATGL